jgi:hypothetical protein
MGDEVSFGTWHLRPNTRDIFDAIGDFSSVCDLEIRVTFAWSCLLSRYQSRRTVD